MPSLSDISVNRPVLATVLSLVIILVGAISFFKLPVREYPDIDPPIVTVRTVYTGANSAVIENEVTDVIEEELTSIEGIRTITSTSRDQVSNVTVEFNLERNIDVAAQDVRDKVSRIRFRLPDNINEPIISKADADAQPIMWISVKSKKRSLIELSEFIDKEIKDYFQTINGVSKVILGGRRKRAIQVLVDPKRLAFHRLTILDIENALKNNNIELPAGDILSRNKEFSVNVSAKLTEVQEYADLIVKPPLIRLKDVADVREGAEDDSSFVRFNGQQGFGLGIIRQAKSNTVEISNAVRKQIKNLQGKIPEDIELGVGYDAAVFIRHSIEELYKTVLLSSFLVLVIIFLFLGNLRSTLIPAVSIPISLIGVMGVIWTMGFTLNLMTLLGLIIAVGIVVDDSIIVLENIYRHIEDGMEPKEAAKKGAKEITLAVIATTLVLVSIFLPIAFMTGITGRLLSEFAFAISFATIISAFVALTMAPMLCSKLLEPQVIKQKTDKHFSEVWESAYGDLLSGMLRYNKSVVLFSLIFCVLLSIIFFKFNTKDFIPDEDRGMFLTIVSSPRGSNLDYLDNQVRKVENILTNIPESQTVIAVAAYSAEGPGKVTTGIVINRLKDWSERKRHVMSIVGPLYPAFAGIPEAFILPILPKSGPGSGTTQPIQLVIKSSDMNFLTKISILLIEKASKLSEIQFPRSDLTFDKPELTVEIDRDKAISLGVSMKDIARSLELLFTGQDVTEFNQLGENYKVIVSVPRDQKNEPKKIDEIAVRSSKGHLIQLSNLIRIKETIGSEELSHHNRKKSFTISASPAEGYSPAEGLDELESLTRTLVKGMDRTEIPQEFEIDYSGTSKELKDSDRNVYLGFLIALLFAYLFLAGQFESFISPVIILLTVPLAVTGALAGIALFKLFPLVTNLLIHNFGAPEWLQYVIPQFHNISVNIYSQIGIIMLIGMASKNGILLVEFINQLKNSPEIKSLQEAIIQASVLRLRPILMTAFSTILGILPIALAIGVGSESRQALGVAVVSGMLFATFLTLFVIPCAYALVFKK